MAGRRGNWANNRFRFRRFLICGLQVRVLLGAPDINNTTIAGRVLFGANVMNLQELEHIVKGILAKPEMRIGVQKYCELLHLFRDINVATNEEYQSLYRDFYRTNLALIRCKNFETEYFTVLERWKNSTYFDSKKIFDDVCDINGDCEISFGSKILHNLDTEYPIWDSVVTIQHFGFRQVPGNKEKTWNKYLNYKDAFERYVQSTEGQKIIDLFDKRFPDNHISDVKKVDFVLWQDRESQISIPDEFCGCRRKK